MNIYFGSLDSFNQRLDYPEVANIQQSVFSQTKYFIYSNIDTLLLSCLTYIDSNVSFVPRQLGLVTWFAI
jgi:hypothetical protein